MPEIEFVDVDQPDEPGRLPHQAQRLEARTVLALVPALLALAAAALAAWAPFRWIYTTTSSPATLTSTDPGASGRAPLVHIHTDGWGRQFGLSAEANANIGHGIRLGIVYEFGAALAVIAALAFAVAALPGIRASRPLRRQLWRRCGHTTAILAAGIGGAVSAVTYLAYLSVHDTYAAIDRANNAQSRDAFAQVSQNHVGSGDSWLIGGLAAVFAALALASSFVTVRVARNRGDLGDRHSQPPQSLGTYAAGTDSAGDQL